MYRKPRSTSRRSQLRSKQNSPVLAQAIEKLEERRLFAGWAALSHTAPSGIGTMMLLTDGTVIAQKSNVSNAWYKLTPDSTGSYQNGTWSTIATMNLQRLYFASNVMPDGRVWVLGGEYSGASGASTWTNTGEIYDPIANTWTSIANYPQSQYGDVPSALMPDGRVLAGSLSTASTYIYNPSGNSWTAAATKLLSDRSDEETWVKLSDGSVLSYNVFGASPGAQRYDQTTGTWINSGTVPVQLQTSDGKELGPGFRLQDGRALFIGATNHNAIYTPATTVGGTGSWVAAPDTPGNIGANDAPGAILPNGNVIYAAGDVSTSFNAPTTILEYKPSTNTISTVSMTGGPTLTSTQPFVTRMLSLPNGQVLFSNFSTQAYIYDESTGVSSDSLRPSISTITQPSANVFNITGTQLSGINEGASYGDDAEMSTNYPIVRLTSASGVVTYARTTGWNNTGVAASAATSVNFTLPSGITSGVYKLEVAASGISSKPVLLTIMGTATGNTISIQQDSGNSSNIQVSGTNTYSFPQAQFAGAYVLGTSGNDSVTIADSTASLPIKVDGAAGTDTLTITTGSANQALNVNSSTVTGTNFNVGYSNFESLPLNLGSGAVTLNYNASGTPVSSINAANGTDQINILNASGTNPVVTTGLVPFTTINLNSGAYTVSNAYTYHTNVNVNGGTLTFTGAEGFYGLTVGNGGSLTMAGSATLLSVQTLAIGATGLLDLSNNDLVVQDGTQAVIQSYVAAARANGNWTGFGLTSTAAKNNPLHNTTLGVVNGVDYNSTGASTFDGFISGGIAANVFVKYTYYGDTDLNGRVNADDYGRIDSGFQNQHGSGFVSDWFNGDFDYNGSINADDYALIDAAYQTQSGLLTSPLSAVSLKGSPKKGLRI